jgi:hypothetical protein
MLASLENRMPTDDEIWDDLFHGCAWAAFIDQAIQEGGQPDPEATRLRAYDYYQQELDAKNRRGR